MQEVARDWRRKQHRPERFVQDPTVGVSYPAWPGGLNLTHACGTCGDENIVTIPREAGHTYSCTCGHLWMITLSVMVSRADAKAKAKDN